MKKYLFTLLILLSTAFLTTSCNGSQGRFHLDDEEEEVLESAVFTEEENSKISCMSFYLKQGKTDPVLQQLKKQYDWEALEEILSLQPQQQKKKKSKAGN